MHRHNISVILTGPIDGLNEIWLRRLKDGLVSAVSNRGFRRESQRQVTVNHTDDPVGTIRISLSGAAADMMTAEQFECIEADLIAAVLTNADFEVDLGEKFQRHPTPQGELAAT